MPILLPTATAGSLPKPSWLAEPEKLWSDWKLDGDELIQAKQDVIGVFARSKFMQALISLVMANRHVNTLSPPLLNISNGVDFNKRETVRIRDRYDASVPTVVGAVSRQQPVFIEDAKFLRQHTQNSIKWALPGPMTMIDTLHDSHYKKP